MPLIIEKSDLSSAAADAIVVPANERLQITDGIGLAVAKAAGFDSLQSACDKIGYCPCGSAVATPGFTLFAKVVVHAVAPVWRGGNKGEASLLANTYKSALECAFSNDARSIAIPLISAYIDGFPKETGLSIAREAIRAFLNSHDGVEVRLVLHDITPIVAGIDSVLDIASYINDHFHDTATAFGASAPSIPSAQGGQQLPSAAPMYGASAPKRQEREPLGRRIRESFKKRHVKEAADEAFEVLEEPAASIPSTSFAYEDQDAQVSAQVIVQADVSEGLDDLLASLDASFSTTLLALIDERGMTDAQVYKRANMSRQLFSKIRSDAEYRPTKKTAVALAIALELSLDETRDLLGRAGFALTHSNKADVIVEYFIVHGNYDIFEINEALYAFDQPLL